MRSLPLYPRKPLTALETVESADVDPGCTACALHEGVRSPCVGADGEAGGLLVVGESPGSTEDSLNRPFQGKSGVLLRRMISRWWKGPVAIDNAVRCYPKGRELKDKHFEACRGYLAQTTHEVQPKRIITLGGWASWSVTGRSIAPLSTRRAFGHLVSGRFGEDPIPIFFLLHPAAALRNRFLNGFLEQDMRWALTANPGLKVPLGAELRLVTDGADAEIARAELRAAPWCVFDIESAGLVYDTSFRLLCISFCAAGSDSPFAWDKAAMAHPEARRVLQEILRDPKIIKRGTNVKFDENGCDLRLDAKTQGVNGGDVRLWRKLLEPEADADLATMSELVGLGGIKTEALEEMAVFVDCVKDGLHTEARLARNRAEDAKRAAEGLPPKKRQAKLKPKMQAGLDRLHEIDQTMPDLAPLIRRPKEVETESWSYAVIPEEMLLRYNARDSVSTARLVEFIEPMFAKEPEIDTVRRTIVQPAAAAIRQVERWGVPVDMRAITTFDRHLDAKLKIARASLDAHGGAGFDANSPIQIQRLLFDELKLKPNDRFKTKTGFSTSEDALDDLKGHPTVDAILEWRRLTKLKGTYASGMIKHVRPDGRIHTSILLDGARSGRTSSTNPNLQNIPRPKDEQGNTEGKFARDCFCASEGFTFLQLDYSQLELRVAAMLSKDPDMIAIFNEGVDYHQRTAELISEIAWGIQASQVEKAHRSAAKSVNFGILYGKTASTLAKEWGVSIAKAETVVQAILGCFKKLARWCEDRRAETARTGVSWTWWNGQRARRRPLWRIADNESSSANRAENGAVNTPIQGTASDFCIASLAACVEWIHEEQLEDSVRLVLPVHDSLLFEVRHEFVPVVAREVKRIMEGWNSDGVPVVVDTEIGRRWGSLVSYEEFSSST